MGEETSKKRLDRGLIELLNELRILLPGVQVLFAFLLTVPFNAGFSNATTFHRSLLLVALLATAFAIGLLVAPAAQHRILYRARAQEKQRLLWRSNLFAISGVSLLAVAIVVSMLLVVDYLFQFLLASICAGLVAAVLVSAWLVQPIIQRGRLQLDELFDLANSPSSGELAQPPGATPAWTPPSTARAVSPGRRDEPYPNSSGRPSWSTP
jgi:hypothetical protein